METNMEKAMDKMFKRPWWELAIRGLVAILFGLVAIFWPGITLGVILWIFGIFVLVYGIFSVAGSFAMRHDNKDWWIVLVSGIFGIIIGIIALAAFEIFAISVLLLIGIWAIVGGILEIAAAGKSPPGTQGKGLLYAAGIISIIFGLVMVIWPYITGMAVFIVLGIFAILLGILLLVGAVKAK